MQNRIRFLFYHFVCIIPLGGILFPAAVYCAKRKPGINPYVDHTLLKAFAVKEDIAKLYAEAKEYHFASAVVNQYFVS